MLRALRSSLLVTAALAAPAGAAADGVEVSQNVFDADGWPELVANYSPDGDKATPVWRACTPLCGAVIRTDQQLAPGPTAPGTSWQASATYRGTTTVARSKTWLGQVTSIDPPAVSGLPSIGSTMVATPGTWSGGWGDDFSELNLRACRTLEAVDCRIMVGSSPEPDTTSGPVKVTTSYGGWYVGPVDMRLPADVAIAGVGIGHQGNTVSGIRAPLPAQTIAAGALVGPIPAATPAQLRAAAVRVQLRRTAKRSGKRLLLGTVTCPEGCTAYSYMVQGKKFNPGPDDVYDSGYREFRAAGTWMITTSLHRFDPNRRLRVEIKVEGERRVVRQVRLPRA